MEVLKNNMQADIVIVGGGGAGLTAALAASEKGVKNIVVLEKALTPGGNTNQSAGMFAVDSPAQQRKDIHVSADEVFIEKMTYANWRINPRLARICIKQSGEMIQWLEDKGLEFNNIIEFLPEGAGPKVFHSFSQGPKGFIGKKIIEILANECQTRGVHIYCETAVKKIRVSESGEISGVIATSKKSDIRIDTGSVILATGGFGANRDLLNKYFPDHGDVYSDTYPEMTGDGLLMAEELNAVIDNNMVLLVTGPHHYPWSHCMTLLVRRPDILLVNKNGERYSNETLFLNYHTEAGNILSKQPDKICYGIIDSTVKHNMIQNREAISGMEWEAGDNGGWLDDLDGELKKNSDSGTVKIADNLEELAEFVGADADVFKATVERYNSFCNTGYDEDFLKDKRFLHPICTPPFYAVLGRQGFDTTLGGIKINHRMEVINKQERPIKGLYATGDCASSWEFANYNLKHPGAAMTFALCSGYLAGQNVSEYITKK